LVGVPQVIWPVIVRMALDGVLRLQNCDLVEAYFYDVGLWGKAESLDAEFANLRDGANPSTHPSIHTTIHPPISTLDWA